jgi:signal transduction histidine kinase
LTTIRLITDSVRWHVAEWGESRRDTIEADLRRIDLSVERIVDQTDELVDVGRLQSGQPLQLRPRRTDLLALVRALRGDYQERTCRHRLVVSADEAELVGFWDADRLQRVVGNLLDNAIKYSPAGGDVVGGVARQADVETDWAILTVTGAGLGIPAADLPRIFAWFQRAGNVGTEIKGSGIGLASAQRIIGQHGGMLEVRSEEGVGSTFTVRLPFARW